MDYDRLRELQEKFNENPRRYFAPLANEYRKGGQAKRAIEICRAHLAQMPGHMSGQIVFAQSLFEAGEYVEARQVFERALALDPENLIALRSLGDMSLQEGNTSEARSWYTRLLEADPKDTTVIALVQEIEESDDATPVSPQPAIPGIDIDVGDQQIPWLEPPTSENSGSATAASGPEASPIEASSVEASTSAASSSVEAPASTSSSDLIPNEPVASASPDTAADEPATPEPVSRASSAQPAEKAPPMPSELATAYMESQSAAAEPASAPETSSRAAESTADSGFLREPDMSADSEASQVSPERLEITQTTSTREEIAAPVGLERHYPSEAPAAEEIETMGVTSDPEPLVSQRPDVGNPLDWSPSESETAAANASAAASAEETTQVEPEPAATAGAGTTEERTFSGASSEPFVNETMAQLYLKQGYRQLALQVYYRLSEARPNDESLKERIREIESAETAASPPVETTAEQTAVDSPPPFAAPESDAIDSPPAFAPRESRAVEREEPIAQPEVVAARQPSIKEFFATLGRRRPSRNTTAAYENSAPAPAPHSDDIPSMAATGPAPTLDNVFAGAEVSQADARAATRLAGAFSGAPRPSATPRTPPVPTPRLNPRLQTQESEEDVAKFRAWLDGLTGE
jgi:tetratricopeptide (TPR) repeat protein